MNNSSKAMDYAKMLFEVSEEENKVDEVLYDLNTLRKIKLKEVSRLLTLPIVSETTKIELIDTLQELNMNYIIRNFIKVLISRKDFNLFLEIIEEYRSIYQNKKDIQIVNISTAKKITSENLDFLIKEIERRLDKFVVITSTVDEKLIGGIKIEYEGKEVDNTIKRHLNDFLNSMTRS